MRPFSSGPSSWLSPSQPLSSQLRLSTPRAMQMLGDTPSAPLTAAVQPGLPSKRFSADKSKLLAREYRQQRLQEYKKNEPQAGLEGS